MTVEQAYEIVKHKVNLDITKYAKVKDGIVFIAKDYFGEELGINYAANNYFLVTNKGEFRVTNPILCGLKVSDVKELDGGR